jgi:hypothetical protein
VTTPPRNRERRRLTAIEQASADAVLFVQQIAGPILQDDWPHGLDYVCGHCGTMVLASCVVDDQIWDLVFQCSGCKGLSASPALLPGRALPPKPAVLGPDVYPITNTHHLQKATIVGQAAVDRRLAETGLKGATFGCLAGRPNPPEGNAAFLEGLIEQVRGHLGEAFGVLEGRERRLGPESKKQRHPLMILVRRVRSIIATFATSTPTVDDRPVMELVALLHTLERWQRDPIFPTMVHDLGLGNAYPHTAITLAAATLLEDLGNSVELHEAAASRLYPPSAAPREPDLLLVIRAQLRVGVEVKAPGVLRAPKGALGYAKLLDVIETEMKRARTGGKGQLATGGPRCSSLAGFTLPHRTCQTLSGLPQPTWSASRKPASTGTSSESGCSHSGAPLRGAPRRGTCNPPRTCW